MSKWIKLAMQIFGSLMFAVPASIFAWRAATEPSLPMWQRIVLPILILAVFVVFEGIVIWVPGLLAKKK